MNNDKIRQLAKEAGLPEGWYEGPWFDERDRLRTGISDHLRLFVKLVEAAALATEPAS